MPTVWPGARQAALLAGVLLVGVLVARRRMPAASMRPGAMCRRERSPALDVFRGALGDPVVHAWSEAVRADVVLAERNDRYAG